MAVRRLPRWWTWVVQKWRSPGPLAAAARSSGCPLVDNSSSASTPPGSANSGGPGWSRSVTLLVLCNDTVTLCSLKHLTHVHHAYQIHHMSHTAHAATAYVTSTCSYGFITNLFTQRTGHMPLWGLSPYFDLYFYLIYHYRDYNINNYCVYNIIITIFKFRIIHPKCFGLYVVLHQ